MEQRKFAGQRPTFYHCATQLTGLEWHRTLAARNPSQETVTVFNCVSDADNAAAPAISIHCKNIRLSADILWRVFLMLTELVPYTYVLSVNRRNNEALAYIIATRHEISVDIRIFFTVCE